MVQVMQTHYFDTVVWDDADNEIPLTVYLTLYRNSHCEPLPNPVWWDEYVIERIENEDGDDVTAEWLEVIDARQFDSETIIALDDRDYDDFMEWEDFR